MQTLTIQSDFIPLPVEIFERLKGKKVEFIEYREGIFIKPLSDYAEKNISHDPENNMEEDELFCEIEILLYQKDKMTLGQASRLARMSQLEFQRLIADRKIPVHYDIADFESDMKTLRETGRI